ncbi:MAG TPA: NAD(P)-dependent oxidoreductase [Thermoleophilaceae bacterium]|jgi:3-hydroxyisobutyrate dehydrogenase
MSSVAVLGTGIMGAPMARNLRGAGLEVRVWNRTRERAEALAEDGIEVAGSPADAAKGADATLTMLADSEAVESVAAEALPAIGGVWIQSSTVGVDATGRLAATAAERGVPFLDAPVLGTKKPAEDGKLTVLASGPEDQRERCAPVFDAIGARTIWLGEAGAGTRMKLAVNSWLLALTVAIGESLAFAEALGADGATMLDILDGAPMGSPYAQLKGKAILAGDFTTSLPSRLAEKDARLILEAARSAGLEPELARAVHERFVQTVALDHGEDDMAAVYLACTPGAQTRTG